MKANYEYYYTYDLPVPFKSLLLYPVTVDRYLDFYIAVNCLLIEKNEIPDVKIISMSYLDFLFYFGQQSDENSIYLAFLFELLKMCFHVKDEDINISYDGNGKVNLIINNEAIDKNDFKEIRRIICEQHQIDLDEDNTMHPHLKQALKAAQAFRDKIKNKRKMGTFEDQIVCVMLALHETDIKNIHHLTIRRFVKILERYDHKLHYEIYKQAEMSGMVEFKEGIDHWMCDLSKKDKWKDAIVDYGDFTQKMGMSNIEEVKQ